MGFDGIGVIDLMIGFPTNDDVARFGFLAPQRHDGAGSATAYLFTGAPRHDGIEDPVSITLREMDRYCFALGLVVGAGDVNLRALREHPDRFVASVDVDPNDAGSAVERIRSAHRELGVVAVSTFPAGCHPQVGISDPRYYPIYATCVDLDLPIVVNAGIAGPRVPSAVQDVLHFDRVCYDFPELRIVMRHGAEPWEELAVKLMLKWPGLHYMTSAFAPRHYPAAVVDFANTRGADRVMYAGYFPMGLSLERVFSELAEVPFRSHVWPAFLRDNAVRVFNLGERVSA